MIYRIISSCLIVGILVTTLFSSAPVFATDIVLTDTFIKTLRKIANTEIKQDVITMLNKQDPIIGVIGTDLIEAVIDDKTQNDINRSAVHVVTTILFVEALRHPIGNWVAAHPEVLDQAKAAGLSKSQLIAYSCLYFYFSEQLKFNLPIPPDLYTHYQKEQRLIESLTLSSGQRWVNFVSQQLIPLRRDADRWAFIDVRVLAYLQYWLLDTLKLTDGTSNGIAMAQTLMTYHQFKSVDELKNRLLDSYIWYARNGGFSVGKQDTLNEMFLLANPSSDATSQTIQTVFATTLALPLLQTLIPQNQSVIDLSQIKQDVSQAMILTLENWINSLNERHLLTYHVMLSGRWTYRELRFSVQDQLRVSLFKSPVYLYAGGVLDPLVTGLTDNGEKLWPVGLGWQFANRWSVSMGAGYKMDDIRQSPDFLIMLGYEIRLSDVQY